MMMRFIKFHYTRFVQWLKLKCLPQDIYESLHPMIWIFLILGVLPLRISGTRGYYHLKSVHLSYISAVILLVSLFFCYYVSMSLERIFLSYFMNHPFSSVIDRWLISASLIGTIIVYFKNIRRSDVFVQIVERLDSVDHMLKSIGRKMKHWNTTVDILFRLTSGTVIFIIYVAGSYHLLSVMGKRTQLTTWVSYFVPHMLLMLVLFQHRTVMYLLVNRFSELVIVSK